MRAPPVLAAWAPLPPHVPVGSTRATVLSFSSFFFFQKRHYPNLFLVFFFTFSDFPVLVGHAVAQIFFFSLDRNKLIPRPRGFSNSIFLLCVGNC